MSADVISRPYLPAPTSTTTHSLDTELASIMALPEREYRLDETVLAFMAAKRNVERAGVLCMMGLGGSAHRR